MPPEAVFADVNKFGVAQIGQVPGDFRLRKREGFCDIADAKFFLLRQEMQNSKPRLVGKGLKKAVDIYVGHISGYADILAYRLSGV